MTLNPAKAPSAAKDEDDDDDEVDLFGSDEEEEDAEAVRAREERLAEYKKKKEGKVKPAAKSIVTLDVKPWGTSHFRLCPSSLEDAKPLTIVVDDETSMEELEKGVREIEMDGLVWGASKLVAVGFGIKKLQINLVIEDEKVSLDELQQRIEADEDHVQSTDVVRSLIRSPVTRRMRLMACIRLLCKSYDRFAHVVRGLSYRARCSTRKVSCASRPTAFARALYFSSSILR